MSAVASPVRELPILFSGIMVNAVLDDSKFQTRRVVTDHTSQGNLRASKLDLDRAWVDPGPSPAGNPGPYLKAPVINDPDERIERLYPRYSVGDHLYVRETWGVGTRPHPEHGWVDGLEFRADLENLTGSDILPLYVIEPPDGVDLDSFAGHWRPSIHMPKWAARVHLEVTRMGVERLNDISEEDAIAEGMTPQPGPAKPIDFYKMLWNELNYDRGFGWDVNPFVWVISFRRIV